MLKDHHFTICYKIPERVLLKNIVFSVIDVIENLIPADKKTSRYSSSGGLGLFIELQHLIRRGIPINKDIEPFWVSLHIQTYLKVFGSGPVAVLEILPSAGYI